MRTILRGACGKHLATVVTHVIDKGVRHDVVLVGRDISVLGNDWCITGCSNPAIYLVSARKADDPDRPLTTKENP